MLTAGQVENDGDNEVVGCHRPEHGNRIAPELARDDRHLGDVLDGPAVLYACE